jgi:hypothetical protein
MTNWLLLVIIVLVSVAFFGDLRRNSAEKFDVFAGRGDRNATPNTQLRGKRTRRAPVRWARERAPFSQASRSEARARRQAASLTGERSTPRAQLGGSRPVADAMSVASGG